MKVYNRLARPCAFKFVSLLLLLSLILTPVALADDTEEVLTERYSAEGKFGIVAAGQGMYEGTNPGPGEIEISVPGTSVVAAYLYWSGFGTDIGGDDTVTLTRKSDAQSLTVTADPVTGTYGPRFWFDGFEFWVWVAEVTSLVKTGPETYVVSAFGANMERRNGAGLAVVYEDPSGPTTRVLILDGLDRWYRGWGEGARGESATYCFSGSEVASDRPFYYGMFVGEITFEADPALRKDRPNALWYMTGGPGEDMPADMVNAPTDGPVTGTFIQGPPADYPFWSSNDPQWDTYSNVLTVPGGDSWVCIQPESAVDATQPDWKPASGITMAIAGAIVIEEPPPTPTEPPPTPTEPPPTPTEPPPTPTEPPPTPTPPPPPPPPVVPEASTLLLLGTSATTLAGYAALQWRARRRR
jgi:hypothetical protein